MHNCVHSCTCKVSGLLLAPSGEATAPNGVVDGDVPTHEFAPLCGLLANESGEFAWFQTDKVGLTKVVFSTCLLRTGRHASVKTGGGATC